MGNRGATEGFIYYNLHRYSMASGRRKYKEIAPLNALRDLHSENPRSWGFTSRQVAAGTPQYSRGIGMTPSAVGKKLSAAVEKGEVVAKTQWIDGSWRKVWRLLNE